MTTILERVPVDRITARARDIHFWRTVLTLIAGLLFGVGWLVAKLFIVLWLVLTWSAAAVQVGWQEAREPVAERMVTEPAIPGPPGQPMTQRIERLP